MELFFIASCEHFDLELLKRNLYKLDKNQDEAVDIILLHFRIWGTSELLFFHSENIQFYSMRTCRIALPNLPISI